MPEGFGGKATVARHAVALVIHDGVQALDVAGPLDVFAEANGFLSDGAGYDIFIVARDVQPMRASNRLQMIPDMDFEQASRSFGTVLVAGGPALPDRAEDKPTSKWLQEWGTRAERYGAICTGAFSIGHAGLLDGRAATTHWQNAARLAAMFPQARIDPDRIHLRDGPLVTSAGVTAGIDLALALVAEDHGAATALACAKRLVVAAQRQGGQSQFSPYLLKPMPPGSPLLKVQRYVMDHPAEAFTVERLAEIGGTSGRSIARMFTSELDVTPHGFVESVRIDHARNLLEGTDMVLKAIAYDCGFGTAEQMRLVFQKRLGLTPARYRDSFRSPPATT